MAEAMNVAFHVCGQLCASGNNTGTERKNYENDTYKIRMTDSNDKPHYNDSWLTHHMLINPLSARLTSS